MPQQQQNMEPISAGIMAGASLLGTGITASAQGKMNKKTREWNEKMYALQRGHSLADWTMQNEYNSPAKQMERLKMAGLNPNMVYGKGTIDNQTGSVRSTEVKSWNPESPKFDLGAAAQAGLSAYYDVEVKKAQIDNLKAQNTSITNDAILKAAQTAATMQGTEMSKFDLGLKSELRQTSLQAAQESLRKLTTDIDISMSANDRAAALNSSNLTEAVERILSSRENRAKTEVEKQQIQQQIKNLKSDNELKKLDINLKKMGVQPGDNILFRAAGQYLNSKGFTELKSDVSNWYNKNYTPSGWKKK
jgi:hypothetical protein